MQSEVTHTHARTNTQPTTIAATTISTSTSTSTSIVIWPLQRASLMLTHTPVYLTGDGALYATTRMDVAADGKVPHHLCIRHITTSIPATSASLAFFVTISSIARALCDTTERVV